MELGDKVIVPLGDYNSEVEGIVVSLGTCYGSLFRFGAERLKTVIRKLKD